MNQADAISGLATASKKSEGWEIDGEYVVHSVRSENKGQVLAEDWNEEMGHGNIIVVGGKIRIPIREAEKAIEAMKKLESEDPNLVRASL